MNETDLGRLLPLVVLWIIWLLMTRRRGKDQEEAVALPPAGEIRPEESLEGLETHDDYPPGYEPAEIYYHPLPPSLRRPAEKERPEPRRVPAVKAAPPARRPVMEYRAGISRKELRRLIVWSEILAPPVGARENGER